MNGIDGNFPTPVVADTPQEALPPPPPIGQPMTPAFFMSRGYSAADSASLADQANIMGGLKGTANDRIALAHSLQDLPPELTPAPPPRTTPAQLMEAEAAYQDAQAASALDATFAPPAEPYHYTFPEMDNPTEEQLTSDNQLKVALHAAAMPKFVVDSIAQNLATASKALANETPEQAESRLVSYRTRLEAMWGRDNFQSNMTLVDAFLEQQCAKSPAIRSFMEGAARAFTPLDIDLLLLVAKNRPRTR